MCKCEIINWPWVHIDIIKLYISNKMEDIRMPVKKAKYFCATTFRNELKSTEALKSLKRFTSAALHNSGGCDVAEEYMENGGSIGEILSIIDSTAKGDLTTALPVFEAIQLLLLRFQSPTSRYHHLCLAGAKKILQFHVDSIQLMLSMNVAKHKKVALKLLTAIATLQLHFASEILNLFTPSSKMTEDLLLPSTEKESVRKYFILFILSFLVGGNQTILKTLMDRKGFLSAIIPGLKYDEAELVSMTLSLLEDKILKNVKISKSLKLKVFNTQTIKSLFDLYQWTGPQPLKQCLTGANKKHVAVHVKEKDKALVVDSVHSFLLILCTSKKYGVSFSDKTMGMSDATNNQLLLTVFEGLPNPLDNAKVSEIILKTMICCPDLVRPILVTLEPYFQPRNSSNWVEAIRFAQNLIKGIDVITLLKSSSNEISESQIYRTAKIFCMPISLLRIAKFGTEKCQPLDVRINSLRLFATMWDATQRLVNAFQKRKPNITSSLEEHFSKFLPELEDTVILWQNLCRKDFVDVLTPEVRALYLCAVLKALEIIVLCQTETMGILPNLSADLLLHLDKTKDILRNENYVDIQAKIVQFVEIDIHSLTPDMALFKTSLLISLELSVDASLNFTRKLLSNLIIFEQNKSEPDVWLSCFSALQPKNRFAVAEYLVESIYRCSQSSIINFGEQISPLLFHCITTLNGNTSNEIRMYLSDVILHLQYLHPTTIILKDHKKGVKKILGKPLLEYLKNWTNNAISPDHLNAVLCPSEKEITSWLFNEQDCRDIKEFLSEKLNTFKVDQLLTMLLGHLVVKIVHDDLSERQSRKFLNALTHLLQSDLINHDDDDSVMFSKKFVQCVFLNETLLDAFNVFADKNTTSYNWTKIILKIILENKNIENTVRNETLVQSWKFKFLKGLHKKLKKGEPIQIFDHLETVIDIFKFHHLEIVNVVKDLTSGLGFNLFIENDKPSKWALLLVKLIDLYCREEELDENMIKMLCDLMKYLDDLGCCSFEFLDKCFVCLLQENPTYLLNIENDFISVLLKRSNTTDTTALLGKILLNDPAKVKTFLTIASSHLQSKLIFPMLSALLTKTDPLRSGVLSERENSPLLRYSEVTKEKTPDLFYLLEKLYQKYKEDIHCALNKRNEIFFSNNLPAVQILVNLFVDKKLLKGLKKDMKNGNINHELYLEVIDKFETGSLIKTYLRGLIVKFCKIINSNDVEQSNWDRHCSTVSKLLGLYDGTHWEALGGAAEWRDFFKLALGLCFKTIMYPKLLKILRLLVVAIHSQEKTDKTIPLFFQMFISHSQFLNLMLRNTPLKEELVKLFLCLAERCTTELSSKHIPVLLASYSATLSASDKVLLRILRTYESKGYKISEYEPLIWGETAVSHYSIGNTTGLSLWQRFNMTNVLDLLESQKIEMSLKEFPIYRNLNLNDDRDNCNSDNVYDPAFLLPLFVSLLSPGAVVFPLPFVYKGPLAYAIRALSSECKSIRMVAALVLTRFYNHVELSQNLKQKLVWMHFINCVRFGMEGLSEHPLPNIATLFFARMTLELSQHPAEMHLPLQNFLLAKPYFAFNIVPEFLPLFHSSQVSFGRHREWLLNVLKDGTRTNEDVKIIFYTMVFKVMFCFFNSPLCDLDTKRLVLQVLERLMCVNKSALLISEYALLSWIQAIECNSYPSLLSDILSLLSRCTDVIVKFILRANNGLCYIIHILNILMKIQPDIKSKKCVVTFHNYLKVLYRCLNLFLDRERPDWFRTKRRKVKDVVDMGIFILEVDVEKIKDLPFYFISYSEGDKTEVIDVLKKTVFLFNLLTKDEIK